MKVCPSRGDVRLWTERLEDRRSRKVVFLSHCLLNENTRYLGGACREGCVEEIVQLCQQRGLGNGTDALPRAACLGRSSQAAHAALLWFKGDASLSAPRCSAACDAVVTRGESIAGSHRRQRTPDSGLSGIRYYSAGNYRRGRLTFLWGAQDSEHAGGPG